MVSPLLYLVIPTIYRPHQHGFPLAQDPSGLQLALRDADDKGIAVPAGLSVWDISLATNSRSFSVFESLVVCTSRSRLGLWRF